MRYIIAAAVYLLIGCAPLSAPQKQDIRPASKVRTGQPKIERDWNSRDRGTNRKNRQQKGIQGSTPGAVAAAGGIDLSASPQAEALVHQLIERAEQNVPSFAHQLKWAFDQDLKAPRDWSTKTDSAKAEYAVAAALELLNKLDRSSRVFCESYLEDSKNCASWPAPSAPKAADRLQQSLTVAGILLSKNSETLKAESLKKILSAIPFEAPYLIAEKMTGADIIKVARSLDSRKMKLLSAKGSFAKDLETRPLCLFKATSKSLVLSLEDRAGSLEPQQIEISLETIEPQHATQFIRDEQASLEFTWTAPEGRVIIFSPDADSPATGLNLEFKNGNLSCR